MKVFSCLLVVPRDFYRRLAKRSLVFKAFEGFFRRLEI